jgi:hypothetical protein
MIGVVDAPGAGQAKTLGQRIVDYAAAHLGQCFTDINGHTQPGTCPKTGNNDTDMGPGECTYLVHSAVVQSGGQPPNYNVPKITGVNTQGQPISGLPYTWGTPVNPPYQPGDVVQLALAYLQGPNGNWSTDSQHTAIIQTVNSGNDVGVINQHAPMRTVTQDHINLGWKLTRGQLQVFRPQS